jgi:2-alkenal reductase (NADP+)
MVEAEVRENKKVVLRDYVDGFPKESVMEVITGSIRLEVPHALMAVIVKNLYLSCDPYMRLRMARPVESTDFPSFTLGSV